MIAPRPQPWRESFRLYADRRVWAVLALGFYSGLPLLLVYGTLQARLTEAGVSLQTMGLFAWCSTAYAFKWVWSPLVDRLPLGFFTKKLGQRRGWLLLSQAGAVVAIGGLGLAEPAAGLVPVALWAIALAFFSATQDIVIDAYRVEILPMHESAAGSAAVVLGYRLGMVAAGAGALILADTLGWVVAYSLLAAVMASGLVVTLTIGEPVVSPIVPSPNHQLWFSTAVIAPLADFMARRGWLLILLFIALYKGGDALVSAVSTPFFLKIGFSKTQIAEITKIWGIIATISGGLLGGVVTARFGLYRALLLCGGLQGGAAVMFVLQAHAGANVPLLAATIGLENFTGGMGTAAFVAYLSSLCSPGFTATQYALVSSFMALARNAYGSGGGWLADRVAWDSYFWIATAAALPGLFLLIVVRQRLDLGARTG